VKARQAATQTTIQAGIVRARRPKYLFSGLTRCAVCGGGFILSSHDLLTCFNARERGTCSNRRSIKRQEVEARALRAMRELFFEPGAFAAFCEGFTAEMTRRRRDHMAQLAGARRELTAVERRQKEILNALAEGYRCEAWKAELLALDAKKENLTAALAEPPLPALHPKMAEVFR
jgi:site-specific DNA recombinase